MLDQVESAYETVFAKMPADFQFHVQLEEAHRTFQARTAHRPITPRDVKNAQRVFRDDCRRVMAEAKWRIQDA